MLVYGYRLDYDHLQGNQVVESYHGIEGRAPWLGAVGQQTAGLYVCRADTAGVPVVPNARDLEVPWYGGLQSCAPVAARLTCQLPGPAASVWKEGCREPERTRACIT
jgi:hypothetical protein